MSRFPIASTSTLPTIIPPQHMESKRDRKRRETVNKIELLHDESWRTKEDKFISLYKEYNNENKQVNSLPPTSSKYLLELYPYTVERDALLESADREFEYKCNQAKRIHESERNAIEAQYWDGREQARQRLIVAIEDRKRKLREEKDGGEVVVDGISEAQKGPPKKRRRPMLVPRSARRSFTSSSDSSSRRLLPRGKPSDVSSSSADKLNPSDVLLNSLYAPPLAVVKLDDILSSDPSSLAIKPALNGNGNITLQTKRGPRGGKSGDNGDKELGTLAPGTATALAVASGQQVVVTAPKGARSATAGQTIWNIGKSLTDMKRMESLSQLEMEADWARIQGTTGRGRRTRGD
ncbi:hypothetical protein M231_03695 [Tremella mesenterica]|uniref:Uncharacterized protein n=1 Tax=Tremella mesenterica TaxID=5217 RepID=A0A4Q1BMB7_TREME|nr:hypothetical protein M231_03695 [Tremella mesenterica]